MQEKHVKIQFKVKINARNIKEHLNEFLNSNHIIELDVYGLSECLSLDTLYKTLRYLKIDKDHFIEL